MMLILEVQGRERSDLGSNARIEFDSDHLTRCGGATIGRDPRSAWVLNEATVSGSHAFVDFVDGTFTIEDRSRHGTNIGIRGDRKRLIGAVTLEPGMMLFIGPYEIQVSLQGQTAIPDNRVKTQPPALPGAYRGEDAALEVSRPALDLLGELNERVHGFANAPTVFGRPPSPVALSEPATVAPVRSESPIHAVAASASPPIAYVEASPPPPQMRPPEPPSAVPAVRHTEPSPATAHPLADLLSAAGLDEAPVTPDLPQRLGRILRVVVSGIIEIMRQREDAKNEFRIQHTRLVQGGLNPLRFAADADEALQSLLVRRGRSHLEPVAAFEDAFNQIRDHHEAERRAIRDAFESMLAEFDPDRLQKKFEGQLKATSWLRILPHARYWRLYREQVSQMTRNPDASFNRLFGQRFAVAYEEQIARLRAQRPAVER